MPRAGWLGRWGAMIRRLRKFMTRMHHASMISAARSFRDDSDAADAAHDTFVIAHQKLDTLRDPEKLRILAVLDRQEPEPPPGWSAPTDGLGRERHENDG